MTAARPMTAPLVAMLCASLTGCLTIYSKTEVLRGDEARQAVRFENDTASGQFFTVANGRSKTVGGSHLGVPFVTVYAKEQVLSDNAAFNRQVRQCDVDQDGVITEQEARAYAGNCGKESD